MVSFQAFEPNVQVNGTTIHSVLSILKMQFLADAVFTKAGLPMPKDIKQDANAWYSQQGWLNVFKQIAEKIGSATLLAIGKKIPESAVFPPHVKDVTSALQSIDVAYHMNHRNNKGEVLFNPNNSPGHQLIEGIGHYQYFPGKDQKQAIVVCNNPYPCEFDRGIITAMAQRFAPHSSTRHDDSKPCRKKGADNCTYIIDW
jgi:hypothetical protein